MTVQRGPLDIRVGDQARLRKPHPCGGYEWEVTRIGADIGIRCLTCGRRVMLPRVKFEKQAKSLLRDDAPVH
ncbi:MAG: DUF951 domain-containing protein [Anaerolineae bacterium]